MQGADPALLHPEVKCWVASPPIYGRVMSKQEFLDYQSSFTQYWAGEWSFAFGPVIAEGGRVSVQAESRVRMSNGKIYQQFYHQYFEVRDDLIAVYKTYFDTHHFVECFSGNEPILGQPTRWTNLFDVREESDWSGRAAEVGQAGARNP
jgi:ketosteroid isomerase-like protein